MTSHRFGSTFILIQPSQPLRCLLIQPKFAENNYWNWVEAAKAIGAKATAPPLGLLTVAALLPQHWQFTVVDLNVRPLREDEWKNADIICTGGMLPQQAGILEIIKKANQDGKFVVVGGPIQLVNPSCTRLPMHASLAKANHLFRTG